MYGICLSMPLHRDLTLFVDTENRLSSPVDLWMQSCFYDHEDSAPE